MTVETVSLLDPVRSSWSRPSLPRPIEARIWTVEETPGPSPLILISHGTGGAAEDLDWLARPLNDAGFLIATVDHHGNTYNGDYLAEGFAFTWERPRDLSFLLDHVLDSYAVDSSRIGAAGFSIGGFTTAALLGARVDPAIMDGVIAGRLPAPALPEFPNVTEALRTQYNDAELSALVSDGAKSLADDRITAGFAIAPAIARLLSPSSLASISAPLEIRWGDADDITPPEDNSLVYLDAIPSAAGHSVGQRVGHYDFLGDREDPYGARSQVTADATEFFRDVWSADFAAGPM